MKYVREYHGESRDGGVFQFSHRHQKNLKSRHSSLFLPSRENTKRINLGSLLTRARDPGGPSSVFQPPCRCPC
mgnify:CR=1 FL=1|jgi:hypothetical protein